MWTIQAVGEIEEQRRWDVERWDGKHRASRESEPRAPDVFVLERLDAIEAQRSLAGRRVLDLACGRGRHALELVRRGASVEAWDFSAVALEVLHARDPRIVTREVHLAGDGTFPEAGFDVVVLVNFLDRELASRWTELLAPGGHFVYTSFTTDRVGTRPPHRFCLEPGELQRGMPGLETVHAFEGGGRAGLHARRAKVGSEGGS